MLVDDSALVRKTLSDVLSSDPQIEIIATAQDPFVAAQKLRKATPDVMLLDVEMPRMDGYELAGHIRNEDDIRDLPIIMITSRTGRKHKDKALSLGVNQYLGKPYQEGELMEDIQALLTA